MGGWGHDAKTTHICGECKQEITTENSYDAAECGCGAVKLLGSRLFIRKIHHKHWDAEVI